MNDAVISFKNSSKPIIGEEIKHITSHSEDKMNEDNVLNPLVSKRDETVTFLNDSADLFAELPGTINDATESKHINVSHGKSKGIDDFTKKKIFPILPASRHFAGSEESEEADMKYSLGDEIDDEHKVKKGGMRVGYYQMSQKPLVRFCFIPKALLRSAAFNLDDVFSALNLKTPDLVFELNIAGTCIYFIHICMHINIQIYLYVCMYMNR